MKTTTSGGRRDVLVFLRAGSYGLVTSAVLAQACWAAATATLSLKPVTATGSFTIVGGNQINMEAGQTVTLEIKVAAWSPALLRTWQAYVPSSGYTSGSSGSLTPVGYPGTPSLGAFITAGRADYVFFGHADIHGVNTSTENYRWFGTLSGAGDSVADPGVERYCGTLKLDVSGDASGTFTVGFDAFESFLADNMTPPQNIPLFALTPARIVIASMPSLISSSPPGTGTLWRSTKNTMRLTFGSNIVVPGAGQVTIKEMLAGGAFGADLGGSFVFTVENDGGGHPRVLRIRENVTALSHRKWYSIRNTGGWSGVALFEVQYVVQVGDADGDRLVTNADYSLINAGLGAVVADDDRRDITGNGTISATDLSQTNAGVPSFPVAKPSGH